jgi:hypothetical protein
MTREAEIQVIRLAATAMSELLAEGAVEDEAWERSAQFSLSCRRTTAKSRDACAR